MSFKSFLIVFHILYDKDQLTAFSPHTCRLTPKINQNGQSNKLSIAVSNLNTATGIVLPTLIFYLLNFESITLFFS